MSLGRVLSDVRELENSLENEFLGRLSYDFSESREIQINGMAFPDGWENRSGGKHGAVLIEVPENYPEQPPRAYISDEMRFDGDRPTSMAPGRIGTPAEWAGIELFATPEEWDPAADSFVTVFERVQELLRDPNLSDTIEN